MANDYQTLFDDLALLIGGTQQAAPPDGFFSGANANDSTGVAGLAGCYSRAPYNFTAGFPLGVLLPKDAKLEPIAQGTEHNYDTVELILFGQKDDLPAAVAVLMPFRDLIPAAFRAHFTVTTVAGATSLTNSIASALVTRAVFGMREWGGVRYPAWSFDIRVWRPLAVTYSV